MSDMDAERIQEAYSRWAGVYDWVFGTAFTRARRRAVELLALEPGHAALEVGVGTGLTLPLFPPGCRVAGVDFSRPMLDRARPRAAAAAAATFLVEGDGGRLPFADDTFDAAVAPYVVSAAPEPVRLLRELARVCRPGAPLVILNHFSHRPRWLAAVERLLEPLTSRLLGFHAHFPLAPLFREAEMEVVHVERVPPLRYWHIVCCRGSGSASP